MTEKIPAEIQSFISQHIRSIGHLELLLLLFGLQERAWTVDELTTELRTNRSYADQQLGDLRALIEIIDGQKFRYHRQPESVESLISRLNNLYLTKKHAVISAIYAPTNESMRDFANAFKLKKDS